MNVRVIPRTAISGYLRLLRLPLDGAVRLLPGNGTGAGPAAKLALDRADARTRAAIGAVLADPVMREDAHRRLEAADERERGQRLRGEAERRGEVADERLEQRQESATQRRRQATRRAGTRKTQAQKRQQQRKQQAKRTEGQRLENSQELAERREEVIEEREPHERLEALEAKTDALREQEKELTARDEARRLAEAAARAKAERKGEN